jgi:hypothetical protein
VGQVDDFIAGQVLRRRKCLEFHLVALARVPIPVSYATTKGGSSWRQILLG